MARVVGQLKYKQYYKLQYMKRNILLKIFYKTRLLLLIIRNYTLLALLEGEWVFNKRFQFNVQLASKSHRNVRLGGMCLGFHAVFNNLSF